MVNAFVDKYREEKIGFIQVLCVLPEFRNKGIATNLLHTALDSFKQRGMEKAESWAQTDREPCMRIYEKLGFKQVRITDLMQRKLDSILLDTGKYSGVVIRKADMNIESEIRLLNTLDNETFKEHNNFRPRTIEETKYSLFEMPWFKKQEVFFAMLSDEATGFAIAGEDIELNLEKGLKWGWVADIGVLKPYRRRGIGACLINKVLQTLNGWGMTEAMLYVDEMNPTKAIKLYEKAGFSIMRKNIVYQLTLQ
jgi:mycothiol synthase